MIKINTNPSAKQMGFIRILFFTLLYLTCTGPHLNSYSYLPDNLSCFESLGAWFYLKLTPDNADYLMTLFKISLITSALGFLTPLSFGLSFISFFLLTFSAAKYCFWGHTYYPLPIALFLWLLLDNFSGYRLDNLLFKKRQKSKTKALPLILFLRVHFCIVFFLCGLSKIRKSGLEWAFSDNLLNMMLHQRFFFAQTRAEISFSKINQLASEFPPIIFQTFAFLTLCLELFSPLMLFNSTIAKLFSRGLLSMQIGILLLFYINFSSWLPLYLCWLSFKKDDSQI